MILLIILLFDINYYIFFVITGFLKDLMKISITHWFPFFNLNQFYIYIWKISWQTQRGKLREYDFIVSQEVHLERNCKKIEK